MKIESKYIFFQDIISNLGLVDFIGAFCKCFLAGNSHKTPITEDDLRNMLRKHRKRRHDSEETPDLDTRGLTLQDIFSRAQPLKKSLIGRGGKMKDFSHKFFLMNID